MSQQPLFPGNQRWREGRSSYRVPDEVINTRLYEVGAIPDDATPKAFVEAHHYSGSYPAARFRAGLYRRGHLVGVAIYSEPVNKRTVPKWAGLGAVGCELGRFVLLDDVPGNGETWFLARARKLLAKAKPELDFVVSFSDPFERHSAAGELVKPGHVGTIYQASNARYCGRSARNTIYMTTSGEVITHRTLSKVRAGESGSGYAEEKLLRAGAPRRHLGETGPEYVTRFLASPGIRRVRHPGNHVYLFGVHERVINEKPYPKRRAA
jgi:hypothetical protein